MSKLRHLFHISTTLLGVCAGISHAQAMPFTEGSSMNTPRQLPLMVMLKDGRVLAAGGFNESGGLASAEIYNPSNGTWRATTSMHYPRAYSSITRLLDGRVLVAGGGGDMPSASAELYDPSTEKWTLTGSLTTPRFYQKAVLLQDGRVLVSGGCVTHYLSSAEIFNPATGIWSPTGSMSIPRVLHTMVCLKDGRVLVAGGRSSIGPSIARAEIYNPKTGQWLETGPMTRARRVHDGVLLSDGRMFIAGGLAGYTNQELASTEFYGCQVLFDAGKGTSATTKKTYYLGSDVYGEMPVPARSGYRFIGWWTGANGTGVQVTSDTTITTATSHTLYAKWRRSRILQFLYFWEWF